MLKLKIHLQFLMIIILILSIILMQETFIQLEIPSFYYQMILTKKILKM